MEGFLHDSPANNDKRERWNEYMRKYREKQKQRYEQALSNPQVTIHFNNGICLVDSQTLESLILRYNKILVELYNMRTELFDEEITIALNNNLNDFTRFAKIILDSFEQLIHQSPLTAASLD